MKVSLEVNGRAVSAEVEERTLLVASAAQATCASPARMSAATLRSVVPASCMWMGIAMKSCTMLAAQAVRYER
jgi:aerobic-type carbon monoxide dehydrogenase small subunit (CoxS/CutS family)